MSKVSALQKIYNVCDEVFRRGARLSEILSRVLFVNDEDGAFVTAVCYGVFDRIVTIDFILAKTVKKTPKPAIRTILRVGAFLARYSDVPVHAAVDSVVDLCDKLGKSGVKGFVNAALKAVAAFDLDVCDYADEAEKLSVETGCPKFFTTRIMKAYGYENAKKLLAPTSHEYEHIRINRSRISYADFCDVLKEKGIRRKPSEADGCLFADYKSLIRSDVDASFWSKQSLGSVRIARLVTKGIEAKDSLILDACSAPGGKAALIASENVTSRVIACDVHKHRIELMRSMFSRLGIANVDAELRDASVFEPSFEKRFDFALCDVPCSGSGVMNTKPDIKFFRDESEIAELCALQEAIIRNCSRYVKDGGALVYSTCSVLDEENNGVVSAFLASDDGADFYVDATMDVLSQIGDSSEFFFAVRLIRGKKR